MSASTKNDGITLKELSGINIIVTNKIICFCYTVLTSGSASAPIGLGLLLISGEEFSLLSNLIFSLLFLLGGTGGESAISVLGTGVVGWDGGVGGGGGLYGGGFRGDVTLSRESCDTEWVIPIPVGVTEDELNPGLGKSPGHVKSGVR